MMDSFLFLVKDWGVGYLTELRGGCPKKGVASDVIFLMVGLNDVLRNTRIISYGIGVGVKVGLEEDK